MREHIRNMKLAALPSTFLAGAVVLGGCMGAEPEAVAEVGTAEPEEAEEWTAEPEEAAEAWATDVEPGAEAESSSDQPGLAAAYNGVCGSGYRVSKHATLQSGTVYVTYSSSTGKNCVVTIRNNPGKRLRMCAMVSLAGKPYSPPTGDTDCGDFTTYAGPVYVSARHKCIDWWGSIGAESGGNLHDLCT